MAKLLIESFEQGGRHIVRISDEGKITELPFITESFAKAYVKKLRQRPKNGDFKSATFIALNRARKVSS